MSNLDDTDDDLAVDERWRRPVSGPKIRVPTDEDVQRLHTADLANSEWGTALVARVAGAEERAAAAEARAEVAALAAAAAGRRWGWAIAALSLVGGLLVPIAGYAGKHLLSSAAANGAEIEREAIRRSDHAILNELAAEVAGIKGELRALNPIGAVRRQGPPPAPVTDPRTDP